MNMTVQQYQNHVLGPTEIVSYNTIVSQGYPPQAIQTEPFIGLKILCRDTNAAITNPAARMQQIDQNLGFLRGTGCLIRETALTMKDGFWLISLPVPRSQLRQQIDKLLNVRDISSRSTSASFRTVLWRSMYPADVLFRIRKEHSLHCIFRIGMQRTWSLRRTPLIVWDRLFGSMTHSCCSGQDGSSRRIWQMM